MEKETYHEMDLSKGFGVAGTAVEMGGDAAEGLLTDNLGGGGSEE